MPTFKTMLVTGAVAAAAAGFPIGDAELSPLFGGERRPGDLAAHEPPVALQFPPHGGFVSGGAVIAVRFAFNCQNADGAELHVPELGAKRRLTESELHSRRSEQQFPSSDVRRDVTLQLLFPCCTKNTATGACEGRSAQHIVRIAPATDASHRRAAAKASTKGAKSGDVAGALLGLLGNIGPMLQKIFGSGGNFIWDLLQKGAQLLKHLFGSSADGEGLYGFIKKIIGKLFGGGDGFFAKIFKFLEPIVDKFMKFLGDTFGTSAEGGGFLGLIKKVFTKLFGKLIGGK